VLDHNATKRRVRHQRKRGNGSVAAISTSTSCGKIGLAARRRATAAHLSRVRFRRRFRVCFAEMQREGAEAVVVIARMTTAEAARPF
jgi:hypothetical protein